MFGKIHDQIKNLEFWKFFIVVPPKWVRVGLGILCVIRAMLRPRLELFHEPIISDLYVNMVKEVVC